MSIADMAHLIIKMTGSKSQVVFQPLPTDDPQVRKPDITRARTLLGWEPKVGLEEGLTSTIGYFKQKMGRVDGSNPSLAHSSGRSPCGVRHAVEVFERRTAA